MSAPYVLAVIALGVVFTHALADDCDFVPDIGKICANKIYHPTDILNSPTYNPIDIRFVNMKNSMRLTLPETMSKTGQDFATYKSFFIADSCVKDIQDGFFRQLDRKTNSLESITFKNVSCLTKLTLSAFAGIGSCVKMLTFDTMANLEEIDTNFFDNLIVLEKLTIVNTRVRILPEQMLAKMPKLKLLNVYSNQLTTFPYIPNDRTNLTENLKAYNNPFNCECSLQSFVIAMKSALSSGNYKCAQPIQFKDKSLIDVDLCAPQLENVRAIKNPKPSLSTANVRLDIIIVVSLLTLVVVITIIVVVLYKRHGRQEKKRANYDQRSPSKMIYQDDPEYELPLAKNYRPNMA